MYREEKAKPVLKEFKIWLDQLKERVLPKSPLGDAVNYTLKNWQALNRYLDDGMLAIDNNAAERLIKLIKIGVKNYLFAGSDQGAENAAIFYLITFAKYCQKQMELIKEILDLPYSQKRMYEKLRDPTEL